MLFLAFEASQPNGAYYRLAIGVYLPQRLVSMVAAIGRLF